MTKKPPVEILAVDDFLFGNDQQLDDYFLVGARGSELICMTGEDGREYSVLSEHDQLYENAIARLIALGVRVKNG
jgi:hypothetical protein